MLLLLYVYDDYWFCWKLVKILYRFFNMFCIKWVVKDVIYDIVSFVVLENLVKILWYMMDKLGK